MGSPSSITRHVAKSSLRRNGIVRELSQRPTGPERGDRLQTRRPSGIPRRRISSTKVGIGADWSQSCCWTSERSPTESDLSYHPRSASGILPILWVGSASIMENGHHEMEWA
jgi:hypothetical protein